jgi:hypothetical protein
MTRPFEIFALDAERQYDWIATAPGFADATKLMCKHAASTSTKFFVYSHRRGERTYWRRTLKSPVYLGDFPAVP